MKRKMSSAILIVLLILCTGCGTSDAEQGEERSEVPTMQIVYENGYSLPQLPLGQEIITYTGESVDYFQWIESAEQFLKLENLIDSYEEENYVEKRFQDEKMLSVANDNFFFYTLDYVNSADFLQLASSEFYTGDLFSTSREFKGFSREEAFEKIQAFGAAVGYTFPEKYVAYAMDTESMEKANQRFIEAGDESAKGATIAQGEFYRFFLQPTKDDLDIFRKEDTYMGAEPYVSALVSKEGVEMISVAYVCQYTPDEIVKLVDPSKAQDVIERKYTDIISEEKIYISSCDLCYYQKENYRNQNEVQLSPIYAFSIKTAKKNPEMKIFVDACTGEEIIVE